VGHVREYSDHLIELELKARRPQKHRENIALELSGSLQPSAEEMATAREAGKDPEVERAAAIIARTPHVAKGDRAAARSWDAEDERRGD
jgi:hypothetical protein